MRFHRIHKIILCFVLTLGPQTPELMADENTSRDSPEPLAQTEPTFSIKNILSQNWAIMSESWNGLTKEDKALTVNTAMFGTVLAIGAISWDYGASNIYLKDEGWFGANTKYGGADKLGHFYSTFIVSDILGYLYRDWGYLPHKAAALSSVSSWMLMGLMEIGDGTSNEHGFSKEDIVMNTLGALTSYASQEYPKFDELMDFRVQYDPNVAPGDILTDYGNLKYIAALKLSGFDDIKKINNFTQYLEFHIGYFTRGYTSEERDAGINEKERNLYAGVSLNFSRMLEKKEYKKLSKFTEYIQLPYTSIAVATKDFND